MIVCGVDEAGRGPWAGPVSAAAVILDPARPIAGLADSKALSEARRIRLAIEIRERALAFAVAYASVEEIDEINILNATGLAMRRAVEALGVRPDKALIDGNRAFAVGVPAEAIVKGDAKEPAISAASILAKTERDALMVGFDRQWPGYGFAAHKGYGVAAHAAALARLGPCPIHRRSFAPIRQLMLDLTPGHAAAG
jgi:ribonuclease HII